MKWIAQRWKHSFGDQRYRQFVRGIMRQWLHCRPYPLVRPGHRRRQIVSGAGEFHESLDVVGCSCGQVFWRRYPASVNDHPWLNPAHPVHDLRGRQLDRYIEAYLADQRAEAGRRV